ncbi:uncharacterized protein [Clytia hemisphaerica]|uniref:uncharacterized protein n=1 Tax=Clytia hemisphaerica TaxID=252671 RepID=UPI0034D6B91C
MHGFENENTLISHSKLCHTHQPQHAELPKEDSNVLRFTKTEYQLPCPFVIYCDFESMLVPTSTADYYIPTKNHPGVERHEEDEEASARLKTSWTNKYQEQRACSFAYHIVSTDKRYYSDPKLYFGENAAEIFIDMLLREEKILRKWLFRQTPMHPLTREEKNYFYSNNPKCHICDDPITSGWKVKDHNHLDGTYNGPAHQGCNLNYRIHTEQMKIPVVFHNLKTYDAHLIMSAVKQRHGEITVIPTNTEKYISFSIGGLRFIDSFQFLFSSLDRLSKNLDTFPECEKYIKNLVSERIDPDETNNIVNNSLPTDLDDFGDQEVDRFNISNIPDYRDEPPYTPPILTQAQEVRASEVKSYMITKGIYPYEFFKEWSDFEAEELPSQDQFYSTLTDSTVSDDDYARAQLIFHSMHMRNMRHYHDFYLLTDVLLLADVFETFRSTCLRYYGIDPARCFTAPGLSFESALKMTKVELELMTDIDMYLFCETAIRGGVSTITHRYAKSNLPSKPGYDDTQPTRHLMYWDANNLYGWAMSQYLPIGDFTWMTADEISALNVDDAKDDDDIGYILEVDLEYPQELHDSHSDYPLAPERMIVQPDELSSTHLKIAEALRGDSYTILPSTTKLIPNLRNKESYSPWLKTYIDFNTLKRSQARNEFEKDFFKLMNNSMFGKTMENMRNRRNINLVNNEESLRKLTAQPSFKRCTIFHEDLVAVERIKTTIKLNRPIYTGVAVLDLAKHLMYDFHYGYVKTKYPGDQSKLLFTDTDSLLYSIECEDLYADMNEDKHLFDFSDYPRNHQCFSLQNKKRIGKMKDEMHASPILEFVGLRAKMYSILVDRSKDFNVKRAKGVKKGVVKKEICHSNYREALFRNTEFLHLMNSIRSYGHVMFTVQQNKISLCPYDDKRFILSDGISTRPYGHYKNTEEMEENVN